MVQQSVVPSASGNIFRLQCAKSSMYTLFIIVVVVVRLLNARCVRFFVVVGDLTLPQHIPRSGNTTTASPVLCHSLGNDTTKYLHCNTQQLYIVLVRVISLPSSLSRSHSLWPHLLLQNVADHK